MPKITKLPSGEVKIEFEIPWEDTKPFLDEAVRELTMARPIAGFRPGHATYDDAKRAYGEMRILEAAFERIARAEYMKAVMEEKLETIGSPTVALDQLVPGQTLKFTMVAALMPSVVKFPDFDACRVEQKTKPVEAKHVDEALNQLRKMRRSEALVERSATLDDLVIIDVEMTKAGVPVEGGAGRDWRVYLNEEHYIPGFAQKLEGMKTGEERKFMLPFPAEHFQKHLAGHDIKFTAKAKGVYELKLPELDDAFAKGLGVETVATLRHKLAENMAEGNEARAKESAEIEMLEKLAAAATVSDVPEILLNEEVRRMMHELEHGVEDQGMKWQDYLTSIKKSTDDLKREFLPQAMARIKTAVLIRAFAKKENFAPTEEELDAEIDKILGRLRPEDSESRKRASSPDYREYVEIQLRNRKTIEWLTKECIK